ncbi:MAG: hypothetical protein R3A13_04265 [Bdellovibrionota bacterium]
MTSISNSNELRQEGDHDVNLLVGSAKFPKRPLFRSAQVALFMAALALFGGTSNSEASDSPVAKETLSKSLDPGSFRDFKQELVDRLMRMDPAERRRFADNLPGQLINSTPASIQELGEWVQSVRILQLIHGTIPDEIKKQSWNLTEDISRKRVKELRDLIKQGKQRVALVGLCHHARELASLYQVAPIELRNSIIREFHRLEDVLKKISSNELAAALKHDQIYRGSIRTREVIDLTSDWIAEKIQTRPTVLMGSFIYDPFKVVITSIAKLIKENPRFSQKAGRYFYNDRNLNLSWKIKIHDSPNGGYLSFVNSLNSEEYRNISFEMFKLHLAQGSLDDLLLETRRDFRSQNLSSNRTLLNQLDFPQTGKIVIIRIYPEDLDLTIHKTIAQGMIVARALQEKYGERFRRDAIRFSNNPIETLKEKIRFYKDCYRDHIGGVHFYLDLYAHGYNGSRDDQVGAHFNTPIKAGTLIEMLQQEAGSSFNYISTLACFGAAFISELKEIYADQPELAKNIVVSTQAKDTEYNYILKGLDAENFDAIWLSEFSQEFVIQLLKGNTIGKAAAEADLKARQCGGCDAEILIETKHIGDVGDFNQPLEEMQIEKANPKPA